MKMRMKKGIVLALDGITARNYKEGDEVDAPVHIASELIRQGFAESVDRIVRTRTAAVEPDEAGWEPEVKAEHKAPENKDEGRSPEDKKEEPKKQVRVSDLARQLGVRTADIILKTVELDVKGVKKSTDLLDEEVAVRIARAFD